MFAPPLAMDRAKSGAVPMSGTDCGLSGALSVIVADALRFPGAVGSNAIVIVQLAFAARDASQVMFTGLKSPAFVPVTVMLLIVSAALPVSFKVML